MDPSWANPAIAWPGKTTLCKVLPDNLRPNCWLHWLNRKNRCEPETGLVTAYCPLTRIGAAEFVLQTTAEPRFVVDCKTNPEALVGHVKITLAPEEIIFRWNGEALTPKTVSKHT